MPRVPTRYRVQYLLGAEKRAAALYSLFRAGLGGIVRAVGAAGIDGDGSRGGERGVIVGPIPVGRPLPHVAGHVVQAVGIRCKARDRRGAGKAILRLIAMRELALVDVGVMDTSGRELIPPRVETARASASRRELPLGLGRQTPARPCGIRLGIRVRHMHDRQALASAQLRAGPLGMSPRRARHVLPPLQRIPQIDCASGRREHGGARDEEVLRRARKVRGIEWTLGNRHVAGRLNEGRELRVGDLGGVHPETVNLDAMNGLRVARDPSHLAQRVGRRVTPHRKLPAGDPQHPGGGIARRRGLVHPRRRKACRGHWRLARRATRRSGRRQRC